MKNIITMNKRIAIFVGISILFLSLFINLLLSQDADIDSLTITNIEALAEREGGDQSFVVQCDDVGTICVGTDKNGVRGHHPGLMFIL